MSRSLGKPAVKANGISFCRGGEGGLRRFPTRLVSPPFCLERRNGPATKSVEKEFRRKVVDRFARLQYFGRAVKKPVGPERPRRSELIGSSGFLSPKRSAKRDGAGVGKVKFAGII